MRAGRGLTGADVGLEGRLLCNNDVEDRWLLLDGGDEACDMKTSRRAVFYAEIQPYGCFCSVHSHGMVPSIGLLPKYHIECASLPRMF